MKRGSRMLLVLTVAGLLVLIAGAASASETDWRVYMRASTINYTYANTATVVGTQSNATDNYDGPSIDSYYAEPVSSQASVVSWEPSYPHYPPYYARNLKSPISYYGYPQWDLVIWTGTDWMSVHPTTNTVRLSVWSLPGYTPPSTVGGVPMCPYGFTVIKDPTGTYAPGTRWYLTPGATGTSTEPIFYIDFNAGHLISSTDFWAADSGIKMSFGLVPAEPTSLLALASGLAGMGGVMWRRRVKR